MKIVVFEDYSHGQFYPIALNRPVFSLKCGILSLIDKVKDLYPSLQCLYLLRDELVETYGKHDLFQFSTIEKDEEYFFISGRVLLEKKWTLGPHEVGILENEIVAFDLSGGELKDLSKNDFFIEGSLEKYFKDKKFLFIELKGRKLNYLFDLIFENEKELVKDYNQIKNEFVQIRKPQTAAFIGKNEVMIHEKAKVYPGVYFLSENGPIIIDEGAIIKPLSIIEGPCYIGKGTLVDGAKVTGSSIFNACKIGGEIENTIMLDFSNKHHEGFIGHSYIGSFVNFGALSTNSDLKNNYGNVTLHMDGQKVNSGSIKVGAFIGDHTKLGIGSLINTGTVIGLGCNLYFEGSMYPKEIPSFLWGGKTPFQEYDFDKFINNSRAILKRRQQILLEEDILLLKKIYQREKGKRKKLLKS